VPRRDERPYGHGLFSPRICYSRLETGVSPRHPFSSLRSIPRPAPEVQHRMPSLARSRLARDVFLVFLGAVSMHFVTTLFHPFDDLNPTWTLQSYRQEEFLIDPPPYGEHVNVDKNDNDNPVFDYNSGKGKKPTSSPLSTAVTPIDVTKTIPETEIIQHAPGWTVFKNLYMSNGTFYVVSDKPRSEFPELFYILSVAIPALDTPENTRARVTHGSPNGLSSVPRTRRRGGELWTLVKRIGFGPLPGTRYVFPCRNFISSFKFAPSPTPFPSLRIPFFLGLSYHLPTTLSGLFPAAAV
jgi:hypothetical protein